MNESLTNNQICFVLFGSTVSMGIVSIPKTVVEISGTGAWLNLVVATIISTIFLGIIIYLGYTYRNKTIDEYCEILVGKSITYIFMIIYGIYCFLMFTMQIRFSSEIIKTSLLPKTPQIFMCVLFYLIAFYVILQGFRMLARLCEFYGILTILVIITISTLIFLEGHILNLKPFFSVEKIPVYFKTTPKIMLRFLGIELLTMIPLTKKNGKNAFKYSFFMMGFIGFIYILITESCISLMGIDEVIHYKDVYFVAARRVKIQAIDFLRRLDGIFFVGWIMGMLTTITMYFYGAVFFISKCFKKISFNLLMFFIMLVSLAVSQIPSTINEIEEIFIYITFLGILPSAVIPLTLLIITKLKNVKNIK